MYYFPIAAKTNYPKFSGLSNINLLFHSCEGKKSKLVALDYSQEVAELCS
jgi:hypothetical protein